MNSSSRASPIGILFILAIFAMRLRRFATCWPPIRTWSTCPSSPSATRCFIVLATLARSGWRSGGAPKCWPRRSCDGRSVTAKDADDRQAVNRPASPARPPFAPSTMLLAWSPSPAWRVRSGRTILLLDPSRSVRGRCRARVTEGGRGASVGTTAARPPSRAAPVPSAPARPRSGAGRASPIRPSPPPSGRGAGARRGRSSG